MQSGPADQPQLHVPLSRGGGFQRFSRQYRFTTLHQTSTDRPTIVPRCTGCACLAGIGMWWTFHSGRSAWRCHRTAELGRIELDYVDMYMSLTWQRVAVPLMTLFRWCLSKHSHIQQVVSGLPWTTRPVWRSSMTPGVDNSYSGQGVLAFWTGHRVRTACLPARSTFILPISLRPGSAWTLRVTLCYTVSFSFHVVHIIIVIEPGELILVYICFC